MIGGPGDFRPAPAIYKEEIIMAQAQVDWDRIAELRRSWAPREEEQLCLTDMPVEVETRRVRQPSDDGSGITYYRCGGGRRIVRKKIGGDY